MRRERTPSSFIAPALIILIAALFNADRIVGQTARWVDLITLMALCVLAGVMFGRAAAARRARSIPTTTDIPGGPPIVPK